MRGEARAVFCREPVVLAENVAFDLDDAPAGKAGNLLPGRIGRTVDVVGSMIMLMIMRATVIMRVIIVMVTMLVNMIMMMMAVMVMMSGLIMAVIMSMSLMMLTVIVMMITGFDGGLAVAAATHRAHYSTSSSLTRMSSPPVTCS